VTNPDGTVVNKTFHNTQWTLTKTAKLADVTDSSSAGWEKRKIILKGGSFKFEFIFDDANIPDTDITLDEGDEGTIKFNLGSSTPQKFYSFPGIVETLEIVNSQTDVIKGNVSGFVNGPITDPITGAVTATTY
jgi:hypothetical protein